MLTKMRLGRRVQANGRLVRCTVKGFGFSNCGGALDKSIMLRGTTDMHVLAPSKQVP